MVAILWVTLVHVFLRKIYVDEKQSWHRDTEKVAYCYFWSGVCALPMQISIVFSPYVAGGKSRKVNKRKVSVSLIDWMVITCLFYQSCTLACTDIRDNDLASYPCLDYDDDHSLFNMKCSFSWNDQAECIILRANETFEGNGHSVNLTGISNWRGLFGIADSSNNRGPSSLKDAPVTKDVHTIGGKTSGGGGFIIQAGQKHFIVKHCSSSGPIQNGGICGNGCSGDIFIGQCWSSGEIRGYGAGGIAGSQLGSDNHEHNTVTISHCYSTGSMVGAHTGGICGTRAGDLGNITVKQSYSLGEIGGGGSGGITGAYTASRDGHVSIHDCYSRGNITRSSSAGICGSHTGWNIGMVELTNVYASGPILHTNAGGLIGHIHFDAKQVIITMSVYDASKGDIIGTNEAAENGILTEIQNSGDLNDIIGTVYCYNEEHCWDNSTVWQAVENGFPILLLPAVPSPSPTSSASSTPNETPTSTPTSSHTKARTPCASGSPLSTVTSTSTPAASSTPSLTSSETGTLTSSVSPTPSPTGTLTSSMTPSPSPTETVTSTETVSPSRTGSNTMTPCATPSSTRTSTNTPTQTPTASTSRELLFSQLPVQRPRRRVVNSRG